MKAKDQFALDRWDYRILQEMQDNCMTTYRALGDRVALSPSACVSRVQAMEKAGVILGYHASVAIEKVRPTLIMIAEISLASHHPDHLRAFDNLLRSTPEIVEVLRVNGPFDYIVRFLLSNVQEWQEFAHRLIQPQYKVEKMVTHVVMEELKRFTSYPVPTV